VWDRYLFDGDMDTFFRLRTGPIWGGALRIDLGKPTDIDTLLLRRVDDVFKPTEAQVSADLRTWHTVSVKIQPESPPTATVLRRSYTVSKEWTDITVNRLSIDLAGKGAIRYIRIPGRAANVAEIIGFRRGRELDVVACIGPHGRDGAYAALRVDGRYVGAPRRAVSYPANPWEYGNNRAHAGLSYFFPVTNDMIGKKIQAVVMQFDSEDKRRKVELGQLKPEVWITAYPVPWESAELVLQE